MKVEPRLPSHESWTMTTRDASAESTSRGEQFGSGQGNPLSSCCHHFRRKPLLNTNFDCRPISRMGLKTRLHLQHLQHRQLPASKAERHPLGPTDFSG